LLWGNYDSETSTSRANNKLIATAAHGCAEIKIWKFVNCEELWPHMKVATSCTNGIRFIL
jgi:hypothetical protein